MNLAFPSDVATFINGPTWVVPSTSPVGGIAYTSYLWSPNNETTSSINVASGGSYSVQVRDANGCTGSSP